MTTATTTKTMTTVTMMGRRWFNTRKGSTYHSVEVLVDGKPVGGVGYAYGYGLQYAYTGLAWLKENGYGTHAESSEPLYEWEERNGVKVTCWVQDVQRKKDL